MPALARNRAHPYSRQRLERPDPALGAALRREVQALLDTYGLPQSWFAETIGVSQSQANYLLGRTAGDTPRDIDVVEVVMVERRIRKEVDHDLVPGHVFRALGAVDWPDVPEATVMADPHLLPADRENVVALYQLARRRYQEAHPPGPEPSRPAHERGSKRTRSGQGDGSPR